MGLVKIPLLDYQLHTQGASYTMAWAETIAWVQSHCTQWPGIRLQINGKSSAPVRLHMVTWNQTANEWKKLGVIITSVSDVNHTTFNTGLDPEKFGILIIPDTTCQDGTFKLSVTWHTVECEPHSTLVVSCVWLASTPGHSGVKTHHQHLAQAQPGDWLVSVGPVLGAATLLQFKGNT